MNKQNKQTIHYDNLRAQFSILQCCPLCETDYTDSDVRLVDETVGKRIMHITCTSCSHAVIMMVGMGDVGLGVMGMLSDLSYDDMHRLKSNAPMDEEALLGAYETLSREHKDMVTLLYK